MIILLSKGLNEKVLKRPSFCKANTDMKTDNISFCLKPAVSTTSPEYLTCCKWSNVCMHILTTALHY